MKLASKKLIFPEQEGDPLVVKFAKGGAIQPLLFIGCALIATALLPFFPFILAHTENQESIIAGLGFIIKVVKLDVVAGILNVAGGVLELVAEELGEVEGGALVLIVAVVGEPPPIFNVFEII